MRGTILDYDASAGRGVVSGDDGERYTIEAADLGGQGTLRRGGKVDFRAEGGRATEAYLVAGDNPLSGDKNKWVAAILAFLLGTFGVHKFYLGRRTAGIVMLVTSVLGFVLLGIPTLVMALIAFIETIIYVIKSEEAFERDYVAGSKAWF
jgi:TM2 domain-containing membrane protein YozV